MRKLVIFSLAVLLAVGLIAGGVVAFRGPGFMGHGFRGHMGSYGSDYDSYSNDNYNNYAELSEEEKVELREREREFLRNSETLQVLRQEYEEKVLDGASDAELRELENEIFAVQEELRETNLNRGTAGFRSNNPRGRTGFARTGFRGMMGGFFGGGSRSGSYCR